MQLGVCSRRVHSAGWLVCGALSCRWGTCGLHPWCWGTALSHCWWCCRVTLSTAPHPKLSPRAFPVEMGSIPASTPGPCLCTCAVSPSLHPHPVPIPAPTSHSHPHCAPAPDAGWLQKLPAPTSHHPGHPKGELHGPRRAPCGWPQGKGSAGREPLPSPSSCLLSPAVGAASSCQRSCSLTLVQLESAAWRV